MLFNSCQGMGPGYYPSRGDGSDFFPPNNLSVYFFIQTAWWVFF